MLIVQKVHCSGPLQAVYASLHILRRDLLPAFYFYCLLFFHLWPVIRELKFPLAKILLLHVLIEKSIYCFNIAGYWLYLLSSFLSNFLICTLASNNGQNIFYENKFCESKNLLKARWLLLWVMVIKEITIFYLVTYYILWKQCPPNDWQMR